MNIIEALTKSKDGGHMKFSRGKPSPHGFVGWISHDKPGFIYKLTFEDLVADDWEPTAENIERITHGRWKLVE